MRLKLSAIAMVCVLSLVPSLAQASILEGALTNGDNQLNDVDREQLINNVGAPNIIDIGDVLEAVLLFDNINNANGNQLLSAFPGLQGLTAYSKIEVTGKTFISNALGYAFTFKGAFANGDAIQVYESSTLNTPSDFDSGGVAGNIADATDGNLLFTLNLAGAGDYWEALGTDNLLLLSVAKPVTFNFGVSISSNPGNVPIVLNSQESSPGVFHDVIGNGTVFPIPPNSPANGWQAASDTTVQFAAEVVPEPASMLAWAGILACAASYGVKVRRKLRA